MLKKKEIYPAYVSKHIPNREKQVILLMIPNGEGWHYLAVKNDVYGGKDCMRKFCESLREHAMKIINLKNKKK